MMIKLKILKKKYSKQCQVKEIINEQMKENMKEQKLCTKN